MGALPASGTRRYRLAVGPADATIVSEALAASGWVPTDGDDWALYWSAEVPDASVYASLQAGRRVNHLPGIELLTNRDGLADLAVCLGRRLRARGIEPALATPRTYLMRQDHGALQVFAHEHPDTRWVQKPKAAAGDEGVSLVGDVRWVEMRSNWLVQEYIAAAHLIDGCRYMLRCYGLITALDPLTAYVFDDGFATLASRPARTEPALRAGRFRHRTTPDVLARDDSLGVSERTLTRADYAAVLRAEGHDADALFSRISAMIAELIAASREGLARAAWRASEHTDRCFELLGFDVLVDANLRPWLLECALSHGPSPAAGAPTAASQPEADLKARLVDSLLEVIGVREASGPCGFERVIPGRGADAAFAALTLPRPADLAAACVTRADPRPAPGIRNWPLDDSLVLHLTSTNEVHLLDPLAAHLWTAWTDGGSPAELVAGLIQRSPDAEGRAHADVWNALGQWVELGLAVTERPAPALANSLAAPAPPTSSAAPVPFVVWNRQRAYRVLGTSVTVLAPDVVSERWINVAIAGLEVNESLDAVSACVEVLREDGAWTVVGPGSRVPCISLRQLGPAVREIVLETASQAVQGAAIRGTVIGWGDDACALLTGLSNARAEIARACLEDGAQCLADDLVTLTLDDEGRAALAGWHVSLEERIDPDWYGPLPEWDDPEGPVVVTRRGAFIRYWRPAPASPSPTVVRPLLSIAISAAAERASPFEPLPVGAAKGLEDLLGARIAGGEHISAEHLEVAVDLAGTMRAFRATAFDPRGASGVLRALLRDVGTVDGEYRPL